MRIPTPPPPQQPLLQSLDPTRLLQITASGIAVTTPYLHWDELRHRTAPANLTVEELWAATKLARASARYPLPFRDPHANQFSFCEHGDLYRTLQRMDRDISAQASSPQLTDPITRPAHRTRAQMEEAIRSSQLAGATTPRRVAKEMLRTRRRPRDNSERIITNNYQALNFIHNHSHQPLTQDTLLELHHLLTTNTIPPTAVGRFRTEADDVQVTDTDNQILHTPPPAHELPRRLSKLLEFANAPETDTSLHPTIRAIVLHFMIAYDHPFVVGNGRAARALFYWSMARSGYRLIDFLSISEFIQKSPTAYARAYLHSETDDNDVTYFLHYNLHILRQCIDALHETLTRQAREQKRLETLLTEPDTPPLNPRQLALLTHLARRPKTTYTIPGHQNSHQIGYGTARSDLNDLEKRGLLKGNRQGRRWQYRMADGTPATLIG